MSLIKPPYVSLLLHSDFLGEVHLTTEEMLVASGPKIPPFWIERSRNHDGDFSGAWIGVGRSLCIVLSSPHGLPKPASVRLWCCVAAPLLILGAVGCSLLAIATRPAANLLRFGRWSAGRLAVGLLRVVIPRSARWWDDTKTQDAGSEG